VSGVRIDLHTHSTASDGTDAPGDVVRAAARAGLDVVALTDHDTTSGWDEAAAAVGETGVALVRGTEISARAEDTSVHLLSYLHDPADPTLVAMFDRVCAARDARAREMVDRLGVDFPLTWEHVLAQTAPGTTIGRPHIADALVAAGYATDRSAAFAQMLSPAAPYYVPHYAPEAVDVVVAVRAAGGIPVFAHPGASERGRIVSDRVVHALAEAGLAGLEVAHRDNGPEQRLRLSRLAHTLDLLVTGSSDYHGSGKHNQLGEHTTASDVFTEIERRGSITVVRA